MRVTWLLLVFLPAVLAQQTPPASAPASAPNSTRASAPAAKTEPAKVEDPLKRESPQSSVAAFLQACRAHDYIRAGHYLDLRNLPHTARSKEGSQLAQQLETILDRDTRFDVGDLSGDPKGTNADGVAPNRERVDSFSDGAQSADIELERVRLRSGIWIWLFSADTIQRIPRLMRMSSESPIEKHLPDQMVTWSMAGTTLWQWIALLILVFAATGAAWLIGFLALRFSSQLMKRIAPHLVTGLWPFVNPTRLIIAAALFRLGMEWILPAPKVSLYLGRLLALAFLLGVFWLLAAIIDLGQAHVRAALQARRHIVSYSALPLAARVFKIVLLLLFIAALLTEWGYNTTTILASLGVGGIAIALAAQKTIENFFGGVSVVADRPVAVGDFCKFGDRSGTVEDIGLRSTRVRTPERTLVTVPNGQFSTMTIENFSKRDKMLFHFVLNLRRDTKPSQVRNLLAAIQSLLERHNRVDPGKSPVQFVGVGTYSLDLEVSVYVLTALDSEFAQIRQDLLLAILDAIEAAGAALALPTQASVDYSRTERAQPNGAAPAEIRANALNPSTQERS